MRCFRTCLARFLAAAFLALILDSGISASACAHAALVQAQPPDGAVLADAPKGFMLQFNEPVSPIFLRLIGADGQTVTLDRYKLVDTALRIEAPPTIAKGTHVLSWRVISEDGHPVGGSVVFSVGAYDAGPPVVGAEPGNAGLPTAIWLCRLVVYASLFFGVGGVFFTVWFGGGMALVARCLAALLAAGLVAVPAAVGLQGLDALELPFSALPGQSAVWRAGLSTSYATTALLELLAIVMAGLAVALPRRFAARSLSLLALIGIGASLAASGHASAAQPQWLMRPMVFVHGVAIAFWIGALGPLAAGLAWRTQGSDAALLAFSRAIPFALAPLLGAGLVLSIVQLGSASALIDTAYGRVLLLKMLLLICLLGLAALNRWTLTDRVETGNPAARSRLVRSIVVETVIALAIFGSVALWRLTPPPRALAAAAIASAEVHIHTLKAMADISISPGRAAPAKIAINILSGEFGALDAKDVAVALSNKTLGVEPIRREAKRDADGVWRIDDLTIPAAGRWNIRVDILVTDFEQVTLEDMIEIRP